MSDDIIMRFDCGNDDMSDYYGNFNGLAEDIARDVLKETGVMFCTEKF